MSSYNWKQLTVTINTGAATYGVVVPSTMHLEMKEICYANPTGTVGTGPGNEVILRQIPSGSIRASAVILDDEVVPPQSSYSPRIPIRVMQENTVLEASASVGPIKATFSYRLIYGRP